MKRDRYKEAPAALWILILAIGGCIAVAAVINSIIQGAY